MSNRRFIVFFVVGIAFAVLLLTFTSFHPKAAEKPESLVVAPFGPDDADGIEIVRRMSQTNRLERTPLGGWRLVYPFPAQADAVSVAKFLDSILLLKPGDVLTSSDMRALGRTMRDFGFVPQRLSIKVSSRSNAVDLDFGGKTPSGAEVYVRSGIDGPVFTIPTSTFEAMPDGTDAFRRRRVFEASPASVVAADFRVPGTTFVKLVQSGGTWQIVQPNKAPADAAVVNDVISRLLALRIERFVWPDAWSATADASPSTDKVKATRLATYGIDENEGLSVALWTSPTAVERLVFGAPAGSNLVHALVHDGTTVVAVDSAVSDMCRAGRDKFLDARIFPFGADSLKSVSVTIGETVYVLSADTNGHWRIESPVAAPADASAVADLLDGVLRLKQNDRVPDGPARATVAVVAGAPAFESATNLAAVAVRADFLRAPANLRSKQIISVQPDMVKRLTVIAAGGETVVEHDVDRAAWRIVKTSVPAAANLRVSPDGVSRMISALSDVSAVSVENLNAAPDDFKRCGLSRPAFTIAVDVESADVVRRNLLLGNAAPGGGRYATTGGADAIFIISRESVAALTVPLVESEVADAAAKKDGAEK